MTALIVSKAGFGTLSEIEETAADLVLDAVEYIAFLDDYAETASELNKPESK